MDLVRVDSILKEKKKREQGKLYFYVERVKKMGKSGKITFFCQGKV